MYLLKIDISCCLSGARFFFLSQVLQSKSAHHNKLKLIVFLTLNNNCTAMKTKKQRPWKDRRAEEDGYHVASLNDQRHTAFVDFYVWRSRQDVGDGQPIVTGYKLDGEDFVSEPDEATSLALLWTIASKANTAQGDIIAKATTTINMSLEELRAWLKKVSVIPLASPQRHCLQLGHSQTCFFNLSNCKVGKPNAKKPF